MHYVGNDPETLGNVHNFSSPKITTYAEILLLIHELTQLYLGCDHKLHVKMPFSCSVQLFLCDLVFNMVMLLILLW
jgi:hypothetical protein